MAYSDLRDFIRALDKNYELKRIGFEVDPHLEITEFADRSVKGGGPALLFEKPKESDIPVLINAFASMRRMELALEVNSVEEVAARISEYLQMRMPEGLIGKIKMLPKLAAVRASRCPWCSRRIRTPASATAACIACRYTTNEPPACTGRRTSKALSITGVSKKRARSEERRV